MGQTLSCKILSRKVGREVVPGELVTCDVDFTMASDTTAPQAIKAFEAMGGTHVRNPKNVAFVLDHASPAPSEKVANLHQTIRSFAQAHGCRLYDYGRGIAHHILLEEGLIQPADFVFAADSHSCTYGAVGAFGSGIGATDMAGIMLTGQTWLRVPESIRIDLRGGLGVGVSAKDVALWITGTLGIAGAHYRVLEFMGDGLINWGLSERIPLANMAIETGAKAGIVATAGLEGLAGSIQLAADLDAPYVRKIEIKLDELSPMISRPHSPDNVCVVGECQGRKVDLAFLGSCTNTRLEDLHQAARILRGKRIASGTRLLVSPASSNVMLDAMHDGTLQTLIEAGATLLTSGCGPCVGTHMGVPADGQTVISSANRNFQGRMGNPRADVFLASPATVAASALAGCLMDPRHFLANAEVV